ncbi:kinesin-like protein KIF13A [Panonychus citri]|uniref:kinesin-like protein KIF13A n=1 Tax=Panonychus citri TaxID=50023 RepID=UPI002307B592|nr:kinesin-like protein KIF13A [Panonychus citri]
MATDKVKVAIRVRPFNRREIELGTKCVIEVKDEQIILFNPNDLTKDGSLNRRGQKVFAFDNCFWSFNEKDSHFANQEKVFNQLGTDVLQSAFEGYNACIFAYGQTGSGKSYTMMGSSDSKGLIPRLCDSIFETIAANSDPNKSFKVEVSYMEIYNEKVHDLLDPKGVKQNLRVREHNILGPYVDGLSTLAVSSYEEIDNLMIEGNKSRTVAATKMNSESSRSHAVFTITLTCTIYDPSSSVFGEKVSKMSLVDLAGSERAVKTGAVGERLKEGSNINKSLTTLGLVISKLADQASGKSKGDQFIPYRDSVLTWLLKDNLGGNSKTVMVATVSPAADNYEETLSTLRYADRAKRIVNHAVVNEDPNARMIRELKEENEQLKEMLKQSGQTEDLRDRLAESEKLIKEMTQTWEEKLRRTEEIHQERQQALEKMGISVKSSGIKVETDKFYLVNLNADPSLNELLVYYLKNRTLVGRADATKEQDIQLSGIGIMPEHCVMEIDHDTQELFIIPLEGARTFINGIQIDDKTRLHHGDRLLWGNNHFFRVACPKTSNNRSSPNNSSANVNSGNGDCNNIIPPEERPIDYEFAREELMMKALSNDPIQDAMKSLERQREEDKNRALEKQREMYERQLQILRSQMSPTSSPYGHGGFQKSGFYDPLTMTWNRSPLSSPNVTNRIDRWAADRDEVFKRSLTKLKEDIVKANSLVMEANFLAQEMSRNTEFKVTLQIPAANLSPNRKKGAFVSEPAILVKRKNKAPQVWSMEKLENKLIDMKDLYDEWKEKNGALDDDVSSTSSSNLSLIIDPFYESTEKHHLIGVANIFLEVLFHDVTLDYQVPIISQQGEVAGRLHIEVSRIAGSIGERFGDASSEVSSEQGSASEKDSNNTVTIKVAVKAARGIPLTLSNYVFCQYTFWDYPDAIVVPTIDSSESNLPKFVSEGTTFKFAHEKEFTIQVTEEFLEYCSEGALSIEVWGHRSSGFSSFHSDWDIATAQQVVSRSLADRWAELKRKIELWVEIHELNDKGEYSPVEVASQDDIYTGGVYQLRQGQQRRIVVKVIPAQDSGSLPVICEAITSIQIGCVCHRYRVQTSLDSYQEVDLAVLKLKWSDALSKRKEYLAKHMKELVNKSNKSEEEREREKNLVGQWISLTEERKAANDPPAGSEIPGAPPTWDPLPGMERHIPVIFLDLNADEMSSSLLSNLGESSVLLAGSNSTIPKEHSDLFVDLRITKFSEDVCSATAVWDSSVHDSPALNRPTSANDRVYLILKVSVRLSHPALMDLVLRKRLAINVYKQQSLTERIKKSLKRYDNITATGVTYEIVSNIPKAFEDIEDRESLALMAASCDNNNSCDGESYIEKYTRSVSAVESILALDRLRQEVAIKELLAAKGSFREALLRKTLSVPNMGVLSLSERSFDRETLPPLF